MDSSTHSTSILIQPKDRLEDQLGFAERLLQGVAEATRTLLTVRQYETSIPSTLAILGNATQVDRVYIFRHHLHPSTQSPLVSQKWEWAKSGVSQEIDNPDLQNLPFLERFPRWYHTLSEGNSISGMVNTFPQSEQAVLNPQNILSIVVVPIFVQGDLWGLMGFDDCQNGHEWAPSEVSVLQAIAHSIGGAIERFQAEEQLRRSNEALSKVSHDLVRAKDQASQANQMKSAFLARITHELKTPLNGIIGYSQILERGIHPTSNEYRGIQTIHKCATHLLGLINDISDFSTIEAERLVISPISVELDSFLNELIDICRIQADAKSIDIQQDISPKLPATVLVDARRLRQVLLNLLSNAIKFTDTGQVTLSVTPDYQQTSASEDVSTPEVTTINFSVIDTGVGIPLEDTARIFDAYEQTGESSRKAFGSGLGLHISQRIVIAMGGLIQVNSLLGTGSTFSFSLKLPIIERKKPITGLDHQAEHNSHGLDNEARPQLDTQEYRIPQEIPEREILEQCWDLMQAGRLKRLKEYADSISQSTPGNAPFLQMISALSAQFEIEKLESLIRPHIKNPHEGKKSYTEHPLQT